MSDFGPRVGLLLISEAALVSAAAVIFMLGWKGFNAIQEYRNPLTHEENRPSHLHIELYFACLMVADLIQAIGSILNLTWVVRGVVNPGVACTVQAVFKQLGDVGVALSTLVIAVHTFVVLYLKWTPSTSLLLPLIVVSLLWLTDVLMIVISVAIHPAYYGPTGYWCWIAIRYRSGQIATEYVWMWLTVTANLVLYIPLFFRLRRGDSWAYGSGACDPAKAARRLLWCPVAYTVIILPISVTRFLAFFGHDVPYQWTALSGVLLGFSGVINAILYTITRPRLHPAQARHRRRSSAATMLRARAQSPPQSELIDLAPRIHDYNDTPPGKDALLA
ncbi:hypothetical protein BOTBODRAFT_171563 [Botryobasidium botryosum FD-172 SS1]|uniref:Uncharacterized protein n=1 Tax=Botryobasidium botryosum (strain FD-172 SS1) TaxID=930990 RepID=A0A067MQM3_BOTB1|nr:hypothetical protein BOTBODRAFT_171563 [Botryobasidium botryosum FD-172 SS1]